MAITAQDVMKLRKMTSAGMMDELITDVTNLEVRNYQHISLTSYIRTWSLLGSYLRNESCIGPAHNGTSAQDPQ